MYVSGQSSRRTKQRKRTLEALAVDNGGTALVVLLLGDPHLLEGRQGGENGTTDPDGVLALGGSNDLDLHGRRSKSGDLLLHTVGQTRVHSSTTRHDNVAVQVLANVDIALDDRGEGGSVDTARLETQDGGLEESLGGAEALVANGDDLTVGKLVGLLEAGGLGSSLDLLLEVKGDVAELLLDVTNDFTLGSSGESVTALSEDLHEVVSKIATSHVNTGNGVGQSETLVDGDNVGDTVTGVENDTGGTAGGVKGEDGLDGDVEGGGVEGLEDNLGHLLTVGLGVDGSLGEQDGVLLGSDTQLVVEGVVPDLLHVVPVGDDTVLNGVAESKDTTLGLSLVTDVGVLLTHTDHDTKKDMLEHDLLEQLGSATALCVGEHARSRCSVSSLRSGMSESSAHQPLKDGAQSEFRRLTHGGGDDQQWRLSQNISMPILTQNPLRAIANSIEPEGQAQDLAQALRRQKWGNSRKTARGASSPAKPALHIPELQA